jgi:hypothetical protein
MSPDNLAAGRRPPGLADTLGRIGCFIIVVLLAVIFVVLLVPSLSRHRPHDVTGSSAMIRGISMALETYRETYEALPPDCATGLHADLDKPAECLVYYLSGSSVQFHPGDSPAEYPWRHPLLNIRGAGRGREKMVVYYDFHPKSLKDTDNDGLPELVDPWGRPFLYNAGAKQNGPFNQNGAPKHNAGKFDLSSAGPDREHGTEDDITNWNDRGL